jgi:hypothetical protein
MESDAVTEERYRLYLFPLFGADHCGIGSLFSFSLEKGRPFLLFLINPLLLITFLSPSSDSFFFIFFFWAFHF